MTRVPGTYSDRTEGFQPGISAAVPEASGRWGRYGRRVRFAISIPQSVADGAFDPVGLHRYLTRAEVLGFESAWTHEQVVGTIPHMSSMEIMTYAAACTQRLRLGCAVFVTPLHNPVHLAKSLATLDQLSRGRIEVGVATGGRVRPFSAFGVDPDGLVARFTERRLTARQERPVPTACTRLASSCARIPAGRAASSVHRIH